MLTVISGIENLDERLANIRSVVQQLPQSNFDLLRRVAEHLDRVTECEEHNHMTAEALAIVFSPNLLRAPQNNFAMILNNMGLSHKLVKAFITHVSPIPLFDGESLLTITLCFSSTSSSTNRIQKPKSIPRMNTRHLSQRKTKRSTTNTRRTNIHPKNHHKMTHRRTSSLRKVSTKPRLMISSDIVTMCCFSPPTPHDPPFTHTHVLGARRFKLAIPWMIPTSSHCCRLI